MSTECVTPALGKLGFSEFNNHCRFIQSCRFDSYFFHIHIQSMDQVEHDRKILGKLRTLGSILFSRGICREFRLPVELLYPHIQNEYRSKIKHPMDFGTLLSNCYRGKISIATFRDAIRLICSNAVAFNKDMFDVVGLAMHVESFASVMFEELLNVPYRPSYSSHLDFSIARGSKRLGRYQFVKDCPLLDSELRDISDIMQHWPQAHSPRELTISVANLLQIVSTTLTNRSARTGTGQSECNISLSKVIEPILKAIRGPSIPISVLINLIATMKLPSICYLFVDIPVDSNEPILPEYANQGRLVPGPKLDFVIWLRAIDDALGRVLPVIVERNLRGCPFSSVWARPVSCVWIQSSRYPQYVVILLYCYIAILYCYIAVLLYCYIAVLL